jgi:hypothetical protein
MSHLDKHQPALLARGLWLGYAAFCTLLGWILSMFHALTATNWIIAAIISGAAAWAMLRRVCPTAWWVARTWRARWRRRWRRPLPLLFCVLALCNFGRGLFNWEVHTTDVRSYRLPRLLHWVYEHGWHWIPTSDARMNTRACGFEWMASPFLLIGHSERFVFLLTAITFCLLPGLVFVLFRELGVARRAAWAWSWVLPTGYCYLFQAGTLSIDVIGAFFAMAAVAFALRARRTNSPGFFSYSLLAAGLMTNQKASNLPLLLPIVLAWAANLSTLRQAWGRAAVAILVSLSVSFLPTALVNRYHTGSLTGLSAEPQIYKPAPPLAALGANAVLVSAFAVAPPVLAPRGRAPNVFESFHRPALMRFIETNFEGLFGMLPKVATEDLCGLGLGITLLLLWPVGARTRGRPSGSAPPVLKLVRWGAWIALIFICAKSTLLALPRLLAPYYPLLIPSFLQGEGASRMVRQLGWRRLATLNSVSCVALLFILTTTPVWPLSIIQRLEARFPGNRLLQPILDTYGTAHRAKLFHERVMASLPASETTVGLARDWGEIELPYWKPLGSREIEHVLPADTHRTLVERGIRFVLVTEYAGDVGKLCARLEARLLQEFDFVDPRHAPIHLYLLQLNDG